MSVDTPRPGSMAAADRKNERIALWVFSVLFLIGYLVWIIPSNHCESIVGFANYYFVNASVVSKIIGFISIAASYYFFWKKLPDIENGKAAFAPQALILFGWFALNLILLSGFKFDLPTCP